MSISLPVPPGQPARAPAAAESIPDQPLHWRRENFIPVRKAELAALLGRQPELAPAQQASFQQLCRLLEATFHFEFHAKLEELKTSYAPFDPDADTRPAHPLPPAEFDLRAEELFTKFVWLLGRANFVRLQRDDLEAALAAMSHWGLRLHVDFNIFDRLEVFARGDIVGRRKRRRWRNFYRLEEVDVPIYQRLVIIYRLRGHDPLDAGADGKTVYIKVFKNIPKMDLEMLLPGTRVRMTVMDQSKIFFPTVSGLAITVWKIFQGALVVAFAGVYSFLAFLGLVLGTLGYAVRSFIGYLRTQQKYQLNLTRSLYYQNLDNNAGVLFRLLDEAEEQESREAMLAYFFLWRHAGEVGWTAARLDREIEQFVRRSFEIDVDFEIGDALGKLERLGLVEHLADGHLRAVAIPRALALLDEAWDGFFRRDGSPAAGPSRGPAPDVLGSNAAAARSADAKSRTSQ